MMDTFRDATVGQILHYISRGRILPYPEEKPGYVVPDRYQGKLPSVNTTATSSTLTLAANGEKSKSTSGVISPGSGSIHTVVGEQDAAAKFAANQDAVERGDVAQETRRQEQISATIPSRTPTPVQAEKLASARDVIVIDWDGPDDPENPINWSFNKKIFVTLQIALLTFGVYAGSAIYTPSIPGIMEEFNADLTMSVLGLTLFVLGYGVGPMVLTPLQELPAYGRNPVYMIGMLLFVLFQLPIIYAPNLNTILAFRFLTGFFGSPALATGGATLGDIWPGPKLPYAIATWAVGAVCGPCLGPIVGGFAAMKNGWQWPMIILAWLSGFAWIVMMLFLPETLGATVLHKRAARLRKLTGNQRLRAPTELIHREFSEIAYEALVIPFKLLLEPAVFVVSLYLGLVYGIFYLFFESFPLVYGAGGVYNWNLGVSQLPFIAFMITCLISYTVYVFYQKWRIEPRYAAGTFVAEDRLEIGLYASIMIPIVTLLFGWTARKSVHWIVPVIFGSLYLPGVFLTFQSILVYLPTAYMTHAGAVFAANDLFRSSMASVFPLFGHALYSNLGLGPASSLLAGLSALMVPLFWLIKHYGLALRKRSPYANL